MAKDLFKEDLYFPSYSGSNDNLIVLLNKTAQIICDWFSNSHLNGPLPLDDNFICSMPETKGNNPEKLLSEIEELIKNSFNPVHPGSLAHLDPPPLTLSILGDLVAAGLNNNLLAYELSPSITLLEESICKWFSQKIGFNKFSGGIFASGGTLSNLNALIAARNISGLGADPDAVFLVSDDAHSSFIKCTKIMGLSEKNLINVKTDIKGCMDLVDLNKVINRCKKERKKIFSIVATLGTTTIGAIDPIKAIGKICKDQNIWLHIDGSIGGIYALTNIPIEGIKEINYANSITINPQKILGITKTSSLLLVSNIDTLKYTFSTGLPYISSDNELANRGELGIQGSRPAEVIKLWLGLRFLGLEGIEYILKSCIDKRLYFEKNLSCQKFDIYSGPLHLISFLPKGMNSEESDFWSKITRSKLMKMNFMLSRPKFKNKYFLRAVFGNYNTNTSHLEDLLKLLND